MSVLYALDPGTEQSAIVAIDENGAVNGNIWANRDLLALLATGHPAMRGGHLVVEEVQSYGMAVGREVFETVFWSGRFVQAWQSTWSLLGRRDVKLALCGSMKAKDPNIRQALIDRYGGPACIKKGGALAGIKSHLWAALALAVAYQDQQKTG